MLNIKQSIASLGIVLVIATTLHAQSSWTYPELPISNGLPPTEEPVFLYNVLKGGFLTAGTTWGTHAVLTDDISKAMEYYVYKYSSDCTYHQLYSPQAGGTGYLFAFYDDVYTDYNSTDYSTTYWNLVAGSNGCFRIMLSSMNIYYDSYSPDRCIGWNPDNIDVDKDNYSLGTNIGLFNLWPDNSDYGVDWKYIRVSDFDVNVYNARVQLYEALVQAKADGKDTSDAGEVYNNPNATLEDLLNACTLFGGVDMTSSILNPNFSGSVKGWTVYVPGANNSGYQNAYYSGEAYISGFAEAWVPTGTLGEGYISQTVNNLPAGLYVLEADAIACNLGTGLETEGVTLFAEGNESFETPVHTGYMSPRHYSCTFAIDGNEVTIGLRTTSSTTANWIALDNVQLTFYGNVENTATSVTIEPSTLSLVIGEKATLTATVNNIPNELYNQVTWLSNDESIATVDYYTGQVMAISSGQVTIRAKAFRSTVEGQILVTVEESDASKLLINEIQTANIDQFMDPSFNYGGWVEFYNPSNSRINLGGLYVSNDPANLRKFQLPVDAGIVPAHGFANIWFDHHDERGGQEYSDEAYKQVDFKLEYEGGALYISDTDGSLLLTQVYPAAIQRCSYARTTDGGDTWQMCSMPTPAASNAGSTFADTQLAAPVVDKDACLFTTPFTVHVTIPDGATLRYTTDGSTPTLENGDTSSDGDFYVDNTQVFRFRLYADGYLPSSVVTRSYIYKKQDYYLPIVSVVTDYDNLYSDDYGAWKRGGNNGVTGNGINYEFNTNRGWERPVNFEYLVPENTNGGSFLMALNQECDFEVCGGWTRNLYSPASSFRLKGNKYYLGQNFLPYSFFEQKPYIKSKSIVVRNGGNDGYARIKDAGLHEIVLRSGLYLDCQATQPAHVFINGQYCFMFNIREPNHKHHAYGNYGIDTDEVDQFEINGSVGYEQKAGDMTVFRQWMELAAQLAADPTNDDIFKQICDIVDIDEYINYMAAELLIGSSDWLTNCNNVKGYRSSVDGKFHLVLMDIDQGFSWTDMLSRLNGYYHSYDSRYPITGSSYLVDIFFDMLNYEPFKKRIIDAFYIIDGSVFEPNFSSQVFADMVSRVTAAQGMESTLYDLQSSANSMVSNISNNRSRTRSYFANYFGLSNPYNLKLRTNTEGARLQINGHEVPRAQFDGQLYAPATITATAPAGYRFVGWGEEGGTTIFGVTGEEWNYYSGPHISDLDDDDWKTNPNLSWWTTDGISPFGYGNIGYMTGGTIDYNTTLSYGDDSNNKYPTYYFLKSFDINGTPSADKVYRLTFYVDDGCVVYVNGNAVGRYHVTPNPSYYDYFTGSDVYEGNLAKEVTVDIPVEHLNSGVNYIAADVHNNTSKSSDIYWSATLVCYDKSTSASSYVSTDPELDISELGSTSAELVAVYEKLPDDQMMADIATPIKVNEVSAANSIFVNEVFKKNDWLELYNMTDTDLDAAGLYVSDDIDNPFKYQIPTSAVINTVIPAHGHLIIWADKLEATTQLHAPFKLDNSNGQMVLITSSDDFASTNSAFMDAHPALRDFADGLTYNMHRGNQSVGRYPDGGNTFYQMGRPTIEKQNTLCSFDTQTGVDAGIMNNTTTFTLDLAEGWNWVSHPFSTNLSVNLFKNHANRILSQTLEAYYSSQANAMAGGLTSLKAGELYKFDMDQSFTYELEGEVPTTIAPTSLRAGWNWIGYPGKGIQALSAALAGSRLDDGDMIVGQNGFSVYSATDGWVGTLSSLMPGAGYLYRSVTTKSVRFNAAKSSVLLSRSKVAKSANQWALDKHAYPNVMGLIADLCMENLVLDVEHFTVIAYDVEGICRGVGEIVDSHIFMTLYGQGDELLTFKAVDDYGTTYSIKEKINFAADVLGTRNSPVRLTLGESNEIETEIASTGTSTAVPVGYYSLSGVFRGNTRSALSSGIYIVRLADGRCQKIFIR